MHLKTLLVALLLTLSLSACANGVIVNDDAGQCVQPQAPNDPITEKKRARYMAALYYKIEDCKALLGNS